MRLKWLALSYHLSYIPWSFPKHVLTTSTTIDLPTPSLQVVTNNLCANFINDREDNFEYDSEYGSDEDSIYFTRNAFDILIVDDQDE